MRKGPASALRALFAPMERILQLLDDFDDLLAVVRQRLHWFP
jgi:hypothetical protein